MPSHATPISAPVGQPLIKCHKPKLSLLLVPRHCENKDKRELRSAEAQGTFQGKFSSAVFGQLRKKIKSGWFFFLAIVDAD